MNTEKLMQQKREAERERDTLRKQKINLHIKLIELLHEHGEREDEEGIVELVNRLVSERDEARKNVTVLRELMKTIREDYGHRWPNEDFETGCHRATLYNMMAVAINTTGETNERCVE